MRSIKIPAVIMTAITSFTASASFCSGIALAKTESITPDPQFFDDPVFSDYIFTNFDADLDQSLSAEEISSITKIECPSLGITSLKGIEYLTSLTYLDCSGNALTSLSVSKNTKLTYIDCSNNQISKLSVKKLPKLVYLDISNTMISSMDISNCPGLYQAKIRGVADENEVEGYKVYSLAKSPAATLKVNTNTGIVTENGTLEGWIDIGVKYYYIHGRPVKSWKMISNKWYYFSKQTCAMLTGKQLIAGKYYLFTKAGVMRNKGWRQYKTDWYYLNASGCAVTGWKKIGKKWYHFNRKGIMACNEKIKIGKKTYKFDKNGVCKNY